MFVLLVLVDVLAYTFLYSCFFIRYKKTITCSYKYQQIKKENRNVEMIFFTKNENIEEPKDVSLKGQELKRIH